MAHHDRQDDAAGEGKGASERQGTALADMRTRVWELHLRGLPRTRIAEQVGLNRQTVGRYIAACLREQMGAEQRQKREQMLAAAVARMRRVQEQAWADHDADDEREQSVLALVLGRQEGDGEREGREADATIAKGPGAGNAEGPGAGNAEGPGAEVRGGRGGGGNDNREEAKNAKGAKVREEREGERGGAVPGRAHRVMAMARYQSQRSQYLRVILDAEREIARLCGLYEAGLALDGAVVFRLERVESSGATDSTARRVSVEADAGTAEERNGWDDGDDAGGE